jgi:hypothetical protein
MRGQTRTRGRDTRAPGAHLRCARLRRIPRQRRSSPAGASTRSGRASARTLSRFAHQDAQTPPSPRVGEGGREDEGANAHTRARRPRTRRTPQVRTPPAHTPAETLQPRRGFHALREGFSPHPLPLQASGRPDTPFSLPKEVVCQTSPLSFRHQDAQTPPSPRVGEGGRGDEGANTHGNARASLPERCARLRRVPPQRRSSPAGASTRSGRASARTLSRFRHQDAQTPPSPRVG